MRYNKKSNLSDFTDQVYNPEAESQNSEKIKQRIFEVLKVKICEYISSDPSPQQIIYSGFLSTHHVVSAQESP